MGWGLDVGAGSHVTFLSHLGGAKVPLGQMPSQEPATRSVTYDPFGTGPIVLFGATRDGALYWSFQMLYRILKLGSQPAGCTEESGAGMVWTSPSPPKVKSPSR